jgi:hypothetical protein
MFSTTYASCFTRYDAHSPGSSWDLQVVIANSMAWYRFLYDTLKGVASDVLGISSQDSYSSLLYI